jgi:hypothetical protein
MARRLRNALAVAAIVVGVTAVDIPITAATPKAGKVDLRQERE